MSKVRGGAALVHHVAPHGIVNERRLQVEIGSRASLDRLAAASATLRRRGIEADANAVPVIRRGGFSSTDYEDWARRTGSPPRTYYGGVIRRSKHGAFQPESQRNWAELAARSGG